MNTTRTLRPALAFAALAVTTSLNVNFLRKPAADRDILAVCTLFKRGRTLAVGEVTLYSEGSEEPVAHVVGTYAIPPAAVARSRSRISSDEANAPRPRRRPAQPASSV